MHASDATEDQPSPDDEHSSLWRELVKADSPHFSCRSGSAAGCSAAHGVGVNGGTIPVPLLIPDGNPPPRASAAVDVATLSSAVSPPCPQRSRARKPFTHDPNPATASTCGAPHPPLTIRIDLAVYTSISTNVQPHQSSSCATNIVEPVIPIASGSAAARAHGGVAGAVSGAAARAVPSLAARAAMPSP